MRTHRSRAGATRCAEDLHPDIVERMNDIKSTAYAAPAAWVRSHGIVLVNTVLFLIFLTGMSFTGWQVSNQQLLDHGSAAESFGAFLGSGDFFEAVFENWESEFLQMGSYVLLTAWLFQRGSSESKPLDEQTPQDADPRRARNPDRPWPVRRGGLVLKLYENSLAVALFLLFFLSFGLHAIGGARAYNESQLEHGGPTVSTIGFLHTSAFWYQSLQNWQSEFLSVGALIVISIYLRQRGSPESKPVAAPHRQSGDD
jgi:hypothetical protein